jgi:mono/diheme cytochrome c family protein
VDVEPPHEIMVNETALSVKEPVLPAKAADPSSKGAELFAPTGWKPAGARESQALKEGRSLFESAGCATCHRARLGEVDGPYSDLLLHDLGQALSDSGSYYGISEPDSPSPA